MTTEPTPGATRLLAAEHLLSQHLPHMRAVERLVIVQQIRDLLDGTTAVEQEVA